MSESHRFSAPSRHVNLSVMAIMAALLLTPVHSVDAHRDPGEFLARDRVKVSEIRVARNLDDGGTDAEICILVILQHPDHNDDTLEIKTKVSDQEVIRTIEIWDIAVKCNPDVDMATNNNADNNDPESPLYHPRNGDDKHPWTLVGPDGGVASELPVPPRGKRHTECTPHAPWLATVSVIEKSGASAEVEQAALDAIDAAVVEAPDARARAARALGQVVRVILKALFSQSEELLSETVVDTEDPDHVVSGEPTLFRATSSDVEVTLKLLTSTSNSRCSEVPPGELPPGGFPPDEPGDEEIPDDTHSGFGFDGDHVFSKCALRAADSWELLRSGALSIDRIGEPLNPDETAPDPVREREIMRTMISGIASTVAKSELAEADSLLPPSPSLEQARSLIQGADLLSEQALVQDDTALLLSALDRYRKATDILLTLLHPEFNSVPKIPTLTPVGLLLLIIALFFLARLSIASSRASLHRGR